jgi:hypothetical protein
LRSDSLCFVLKLVSFLLTGRLCSWKIVGRNGCSVTSGTIRTAVPVSCSDSVVPTSGRRSRSLGLYAMSSMSPRKSIDSLASGTSTPSLSQFSLSQIESPRAPPQKFPLRRGSTASSIASIGGVLDPSQHHGSIAESGQNGTISLVIPQLLCH